MSDGTVRILLVDDDEDDYILTRDHLTDLGASRFELEWQPTYQAGLAAIKEKRHHVYLFDYRLGEQDGLKLLQHAIASDISAPIILLTSQGDREVDLRAMEMGAADYLNKSTVTSELLERSIRYGLERTRAGEALRESHQKCLRAEARLQQAQKMEAIGTLAGGIAHDFNNILSAVLGYAEIAGLSLPEGHSAKSDLEEVLKAGHRAKTLVGQILSFARQGEKERRPIQVQPIVKESLKLIRSTLPADIEIRQCIEENIGIVEADPTQIHQVMMNLCTNAAHAMREQGGILEIELTRVDLGALVDAHLPDPHPGPYQRLTVKDTGHGMPPEVAGRIFEPYFTTKEKGEGTGLGLAVAQGIIKDCGGSITVYSESGKGTTFHVYLPIKEDRAFKTETATLLEAVLEGSERILLVDDETTILNLGQQLLGQLGYDVVTSTSGTEALELFRENPSRFDLVITDMAMPGLRGDRLAKELMDIRPQIPVILCSGYSDHIREERAQEMGVRAYLLKPIESHKLARAVRQALDE